MTVSAVDLVAIAALALLAGGWGAFQLWLDRRDPGHPGLRRECDGGCGSCERREAGAACAQAPSDD